MRDAESRPRCAAGTAIVRSPAQLSPQLTIGTPDANGKQARGVASARIDVMRGDPATLEDEADVSIQLGDAGRVSPQQPLRL